MKQCIIATACVIASILLTTTATAQLTNVVYSDDSSVVVDKVYAGLLAGTSCYYETREIDYFTAFRVGASASWKISKSLTLGSWAAAEYEAVSGTSFGLSSFYLQYRPSKRWTIEGGRMATLAAQQHRPHPVSNPGQFETWTQAQLPGGAPAINVKYKPSDKSMIGIGVASRNAKPEYQAAATIGRVQVSGFHQVCSNTTGIGLTYTSERFINTSFWKSDAMGSFSFLNVSSTHNIWLYTDFGYSLTKSDIIRWETGAVKLFKSKYVKGALGLGYNYENKAIKGYLFVTL